MNLKGQLSRFELQTFHDIDLKLKQSKYIKLFHTNDKFLFYFCIIITCQNFQNQKIRCWN